MEITTLNIKTFSEKSAELISKIDFNPDIIVGILNGGGHVLNNIKKVKKFEGVQFESIILQRSNRLKNNYFIRVILKLLPYSVTNWLRIYESNKAKKSIDTLNLDNLSNSNIDFKFNSNSKKTVDNILIIDDAVDTGKTMFIVKNHLIKEFPKAKIKTAVISWTIENSIVVPDYYLFKNSLVRYPWSKDYKGKDFEKKALVVDLDGTLFTINTFHYFIKYLIKFCVKRIKIILLVKLCFAISSRIYVSHNKMKYNILKLLKNRNDINYEAFVKSISSKKRDIPHLQDTIFSVKILATAAPSCYANIIAKNEGLVCLGTDFPYAKFDQTFENSKVNKKENVLKYLENQNIYEVDTFITDHIDDFPLIKIATSNIIVNPQKELLNMLKQNSISFEGIS